MIGLRGGFPPDQKGAAVIQRIRGVAACAAVLVGLAGAAGAVPIVPVSYDMANGHGHALGGWYNYWDKSYDGSGDVEADGAPLTGGLGDLVDGVVPLQIWDDVENHEGTGPYVGWININPVIVFHFDDDPLITTVRVHTDDSLGQGGVTPPSAVVVNGTWYPVELAEERSGAPFAIEIAELALRGEVTVELVRRSPWVFVSEVTFEGVVPQAAGPEAVAEPGTVALMGFAVAGLLGLRRRQG
jgi:hypothetical protein